MFPGNRTVVTTAEEIVDAMEARYGAAQRNWVMDRGMTSEAKLRSPRGPTTELLTTASLEWTIGQMREPDFFLVGAPRSGTTAMDAYLKQHPEIFMPHLKDFHFFGSDLPFIHRPPRAQRDYLAHFEPARDQKRVGESSVWYLYSRRAASEIKAFCAEASILIMLRNPVDMMYSLHSQRLAIGGEDIEDFVRALAAEDARRRGIGLPRHPGMQEAVFYRRIARYADQVGRYLEVFGRDNVHVVVFDDFERDTARTYADVLRFLGVSTEFRPEFPVVNANRRTVSKAATHLLWRPPGLVLRLGSLLVSRTVQRRTIEFLTRLVAKTEPRPAMDPALRAQLQAEFAPEVERLSALLGRDLTGWTRS